MKIKDPWKESYEEESAPELDARITRAVHAELKAGKKSWFTAPWALMPAGAFAALALAFLLWPKTANKEEGLAASDFVEMLREKPLLDELEVLQQAEMWERIEKEQWQKAKS